MPVNAVSSGDTVSYTRDTSKDTKGNQIDTQMFLKLLVAQLKYQDPLEPQKDTAFVTQMAQMSSLQEMQQIRTTLQNSQAYDMVGKEIYAEVFNKDTHETLAYIGIVDSVAIKDGIPYVVVGNKAINIADVKQVFPAPVPEETPEAEETPEDTPPDDDDTPTDETV